MVFIQILSWSYLLTILVTQDTHVMEVDIDRNEENGETLELHIEEDNDSGHGCFKKEIQENIAVQSGQVISLYQRWIKILGPWLRKEKFCMWSV